MHFEAAPPAISRRKFLGYSISAFAATALSIPGVNCGPGIKAPPLRGIGTEEYVNMQCLAEVFLEGNPIQGFDLGLALDRYVYGHPTPLDVEDIVMELAGVPSSRLAALVLDFSWTPLVALDRKARIERLLGWKHSSSSMKRGLFSILRQTTFFLLSSDKSYQQFAGYTG